MDKDNWDDFIFARLSHLKLPVTFRISQLEDARHPQPFMELLENPELWFHGTQLLTLSDLYVTCQLIANNKLLMISFCTSFKAFKDNYMWVDLG
ncbi:hypothetical protein L208DRAFT_1265658 [Tricholoma matsutake]|nr:hypothetical protein L208DRAFT_1265658 [Tricholoma matsutake 945]